MARATLDKSRDYGTITGDHYGRAFEQDGKTFGQDGKEIVVTDGMRLAQIAKETEAAAESGDDKDAVIARLTAQLASVTAKLEGKDALKADDAAKDAKIAELEKATSEALAKLGDAGKASGSTAGAKDAKTSTVDAQLAKQ